MFWSTGKEAFYIVLSHRKKIEAHYRVIKSLPETPERIWEMEFLRQAYREFQIMNDDILSLMSSRDELLLRYMESITASELIEWLSEYQEEHRQPSTGVSLQ